MPEQEITMSIKTNSPPISHRPGQCTSVNAVVAAHVAADRIAAPADGTDHRRRTPVDRIAQFSREICRPH
jgi:hypothetical protein